MYIAYAFTHWPTRTYSNGPSEIQSTETKLDILDDVFYACEGSHIRFVCSCYFRYMSIGFGPVSIVLGDFDVYTIYSLTLMPIFKRIVSIIPFLILLIIACAFACKIGAHSTHIPTLHNTTACLACYEINLNITRAN